MAWVSVKGAAEHHSVTKVEQGLTEIETLGSTEQRFAEQLRGF